MSAPIFYTFGPAWWLTSMRDPRTDPRFSFASCNNRGCKLQQGWLRRESTQIHIWHLLPAIDQSQPKSVGNRSRINQKRTAPAPARLSAAYLEQLRVEIDQNQ